MPNFLPQLLIFDTWGPLILRIVLGVIFIFHGYPKLKSLDHTAAMMAQMGFHPAKFWALIISVLEFFGGILLIIGLGTQLIAAFFTIQLTVIILWLKKDKGFSGMEFDLALLAIALSLLFLGSGVYGFDLPL